MLEADFPLPEYEARLERAQALMHTGNLDCLFFCTEPEIRYFTGFRTLFWQSPTRPWFLVVPASGKPIAVVPSIGAHLMGETWIDDIRVFASPNETDDGVSQLGGLLKDKTRIGVPMGRESLLRMPLNDFSRLRDICRNSAFADASPLVQSLRQVKSEAEIDIISEICQIGSRAFAAAPGLFCAGQTLKDVFRKFRIELLQQGADDVPYLVGGAGPSGYGDVISPPSDQRLQTGDILMLDTGATLNGYHCDFDRNFAIVNPGDAAKAAHRKLFEATEATLAVARPGKTCADLFHAMANVLGGGDGDVGRFGHGLGMQLTESPSIIGFDQTVLKPGMVMTLEPSITVTEGRIMVTEENIVIRDGAPQILTERAGPDIPVL